MLAGKMNTWPKRAGGLLVALLFCFAPLAGAERLPFRTYSTADGLAHNTVNRIVRSSRGLL